MCLHLIIISLLFTFVSNNSFLVFVKKSHSFQYETKNKYLKKYCWPPLAIFPETLNPPLEILAESSGTPSPRFSTPVHVWSISISKNELKAFQLTETKVHKKVLITYAYKNCYSWIVISCTHHYVHCFLLLVTILFLSLL